MIDIGMVSNKKIWKPASFLVETSKFFSAPLGFYGAEIRVFMVPNSELYGAELRVIWCRNILFFSIFGTIQLWVRHHKTLSSAPYNSVSAPYNSLRHHTTLSSAPRNPKVSEIIFGNFYEKNCFQANEYSIHTNHKWHNWMP